MHPYHVATFSCVFFKEHRAHEFRDVENFSSFAINAMFFVPAGLTRCRNGDTSFEKVSVEALSSDNSVTIRLYLQRVGRVRLDGDNTIRCSKTAPVITRINGPLETVTNPVESGKSLFDDCRRDKIEIKFLQHISTIRYSVPIYVYHV